MASSADDVTIQINGNRGPRKKKGNSRIRTLIRKAFETIDVDGSNDLSREEITLFMRKRILEEKVESIRNKAGVNTHKSLTEEIKRSREEALNIYAGWDVGVEVEFLHKGVHKIAFIQSIQPTKDGDDYEAMLEILSNSKVVGPIGISDMKKKHKKPLEDFVMDDIDDASKIKISKHVGDSVYRWMLAQDNKPDIKEGAQKFFKRYMFLCDNLVRKADVDGNGSIDVDEFVSIFCHNGPLYLSLT